MPPKAGRTISEMTENLSSVVNLPEEAPPINRRRNLSSKHRIINVGSPWVSTRSIKRHLYQKSCKDDSKKQS